MSLIPKIIGGGGGGGGLTESEVDARVVTVAGNTLNTQNLSSGLIADDAVWQINLGQNHYGTLLLTTNNGVNNEHAVVAIRVTTSTIFCDIVAGGSNVERATGVLSGTTGTDGKITVSVATNRRIYIENRMGGNRLFIVTINGVETP